MEQHYHGAASVDTEAHGLKKHSLSPLTVVFMIFALICAGCYGIEEMIPESGPGLSLVMLMVLPFVWALPFGLVAAELGAVRPQEGGYYKWVQEALGEFWGFQAGWWRTISIYIDNSLYVILAGGYVAMQWNLSPTAEFAFKAAMIIFFVYINIRGIRDVGVISTILGLLVLVAFILVALCGFLHWQGGAFTPFVPAGTAAGFADWTYYLGMGLSVAMWMYSGYESMSTISGELTNPQVIPKATLISIPLIAITYVLPTLAALGSLGQWESWGTEVGTIGYADVVTTFWGPAFGLIFVVIAVMSQFSIYNSYIASGSRGFFSLADDYLAPPILARCDKKFGVPVVAVVSVGVVNLILCNFAFSTVVVVDVFLLTASYFMVYLSAMILRKRIPREEYPFRIPGGRGLLLCLCLVPMVIVVCSFYINGTDYFLGGMLGILSGPVLYLIWKRRYGGLAKKDPVAFPINPRTGLARGDLRRLALMLGILGVMGVVALPWLNWFEGEWGPAYYLETHGAGLLGNFHGMLIVISWIGILCIAAAVVLLLVARKVERVPGSGEPEA